MILQEFQWVDSPATTQAEADELLKTATDVYEARGALVLSASYRIIENQRLTIGVSNLLNAYPSPQYNGWTDQGGFNDSVQMGADGLFAYSRLGFQF